MPLFALRRTVVECPDLTFIVHVASIKVVKIFIPKLLFIPKNIVSANFGLFYEEIKIISLKIP